LYIICFIRIKKSPFSQLRKFKARLTLLQQATENSKERKRKQRARTMKQNISHKDREISILMIKKRQSEVNISSTSHREFQRRKDKTGYKGPRNKNQKDQKIVNNHTRHRIVHLGILTRSLPDIRAHFQN
jgi:hypothetical protein